MVDPKIRSTQKCPNFRSEIRKSLDLKLGQVLFFNNAILFWKGCFSFFKLKFNFFTKTFDYQRLALSFNYRIFPLSIEKLRDKDDKELFYN